VPHRGAHQRRRPLLGGRYDLNLADVLLGLVCEVLLVALLLAAVFSGR
jgi:hypothetical protein